MYIGSVKSEGLSQIGWASGWTAEERQRGLTTRSLHTGQMGEPENIAARLSSENPSCGAVDRYFERLDVVQDGSSAQRWIRQVDMVTALSGRAAAETRFLLTCPSTFDLLATMTHGSWLMANVFGLSFTVHTLVHHWQSRPKHKAGVWTSEYAHLRSLQSPRSDRLYGLSIRSKHPPRSMRECQYLCPMLAWFWLTIFCAFR